MLNQPEVTVTPEIEEMLVGVRERARLWEEVEAAGIVIEYKECAIIVRNAYRVRAALKARGFRWNAPDKTWYFTTKTYYGFRVSCGRLLDCKIRHIPEPANWIVDVHAALMAG